MINYLYALLVVILISSCTKDEGVNFQPDTFYLHTASTVVNEKDGAVNITFNTSESYNTDINFNFTLTGTADQSIDYTILATNATILAGDFSTTITLNLIDDSVIENQEDIIITVTDSSSSEIHIDSSDQITLTIIDDESIAYQNGVLINNFGNPTGTVSYISHDFNTVKQSIYNTVNSENAGNGLLSIGFNTDKAYLISNSDNKITVVDRYSFFKETDITTNLNNPRYFAASGTTGYITNWGDPLITSDDFITLIDLETNAFIASIPVDEKPEKIVAKNGKIYISHKGSTPNLTIINASDNTTSTVALNGIVMSDLVFDDSNTLWVLSEGNAMTAGKLIKYNIADESTIELDFAIGEQPKNLNYYNGSVYYNLNNNIYTLLQTDTMLPTSEIITTPVYKIALNDGKIYVTDDGDSISNGTLKVFNLTDNQEIESIPTGIIPSGIYFN